MRVDPETDMPRSALGRCLTQSSTGARFFDNAGNELVQCPICLQWYDPSRGHCCNQSMPWPPMPVWPNGGPNYTFPPAQTSRNYKCPCGGEFNWPVMDLSGNNVCPFCGKVLEGFPKTVSAGGTSGGVKG